MNSLGLFKCQCLHVLKIVIGIHWNGTLLNDFSKRDLTSGRCASPLFTSTHLTGIGRFPAILFNVFRVILASVQLVDPEPHFSVPHFCHQDRVKFHASDCVVDFLVVFMVRQVHVRFIDVLSSFQRSQLIPLVSLLVVALSTPHSRVERSNSR